MELPGKFIVLPAVRKRRYLLYLFVYITVQGNGREIAPAIGAQGHLKLRLRHNGCPLGNCLDPLHQLPVLLIPGADVIENRCMFRNHVGHIPAVLIDIVDGTFRRHVFPEVIHAYVHKLTGIQGASSVPRPYPMGCLSKIFKENTGQSHVGIARKFKFMSPRMPHQAHVHIIKISPFGQPHLTVESLLSRTAHIDDGTGQILPLRREFKG